MRSRFFLPMRNTASNALPEMKSSSYTTCERFSITRSPAPAPPASAFGELGIEKLLSLCTI